MTTPQAASTGGRGDRFATGWSERRLRFAAAGIIVLLALMVAVLRIYRLDEAPPYLYYGEGAHAVNALQILQGKHAVYFPEYNGREALNAYTIALTTSLLGRTVWAARLPTTLAGAGTVFVMFWLGRLLFGRDEGGRATLWRGLVVGGIAAGLMAVSIGQTILGRGGVRASFLPLLLCLCWLFVWRGWSERSWWRAAAGGICMGLLPYTYIAARFVPFLFLFFGLTFLIPFRSEIRAKVRAGLPWMGLFAAVAGVVAAPILIYFALNPEDFFERSNQVLVFRAGGAGAGPVETVVRNAWEHLLAFGFRGDMAWSRNFNGRPMLNPWEAVSFLIGVGMAVWGWRRRPAYRLLLLWLGVMMMPTLLAKDSAPHFLRMMGAAPAVYLLCAAGVAEVMRLVGKRFARGRGGRVQILMAAVIGVLILGQGVGTYRNYFHRWLAAVPEADRSFMGKWGELAEVVREQPSKESELYLIPGYAWFYSFLYLDGIEEPDHVVYLSGYDLVSKVRSKLAEEEGIATVKVVNWKDDRHYSWSRQRSERFVDLLSKYGRKVGRDEFAHMFIHSYEDVSVEEEWRLYERLEPLRVDFDKGISLLGLALVEGERQLASAQTPSLARGEPLWVTLQWMVSAGQESTFSVSLRLHNADGAGVFQRDDVLRDLTEHASTRTWQADTPVETLHLIDLPPELPAGEYELRLVVYDFETLAPTVELGVWEPEIVLARLRVGG